MLIIHGGAGIHNKSQFNDFKLMIKTCLKNTQTSIEAVTFLENHQLANAGFGKHSTHDECDASITTRDGYENFSSVASIPNSNHWLSPIQAVEKLLNSDNLDKCLCGDAIYESIQMDRQKVKLKPDTKITNGVTKSGLEQKSEQLFEFFKPVTDTVGAICENFICSSSCGPKLKHRGRIGPVAMPGCTSYSSKNISMMASGSGQLLTKLFCISLFHELDSSINDSSGSYTPTEDIISEFICRKTKHDGSIVGVIVAIQDQNSNKTELYAVHNSPTFLFGYKTKTRLRCFMSECHDGFVPSVHVEKLNF